MTQARDLADGKFDTSTLVVDAANNRVGIGTAAPDVASHIVGTNGKTTLASHDAQTAAVVENNSDAQFAIIANSSNSSQLFFGDESSELVGRIRYDHSADAMRFYTNSSERLRVLSGGGLTFNGDTAAANALDDYEEGTWTPTSGIGSAAANSGHYTKVGRLVTVYGDITFTGSGTVNADIDGLPYTVASPQTGGAVGWNNIASGTMIIAVSGQPRLALYNGQSSLVTIPNNGRILFGVSYQTS